MLAEFAGRDCFTLAKAQRAEIVHLLNELLLIITFGSDWYSASVARARLDTDMRCRFVLIIYLICRPALLRISFYARPKSECSDRKGTKKKLIVLGKLMNHVLEGNLYYFMNLL